MAKSLRAKAKQANRRKKRTDENSHYKAVAAARVQELSDRLLGKDKENKEAGGAGAGEGEGEDEDMDGGEGAGAEVE